ncbi:MAG: hypothetical protein JWP87_5911 [Labilithrix sp.]|nr:hypothetical protein [Labilithrix sp.]
MRGVTARVFAAAGLLTAALVSSCASLSGLDGFGLVGCPENDAECNDAGLSPDVTSGGKDSSMPPADAANDTQSGPPACDTKTDPACLPLPVGWTLVAMASAPDAGAPACPTGLATASDVGETPSARTDTCQCATCSVTQSASCAGAIAQAFGGPTCPTAGTSLSNNPPGNCLQDLFTGDRTGGTNKLTLPAPTLGQCTAAAPVLHADRVDFAARSRICDDTGRCSGGFCDARVPAPFVACIASPPSTADDDRACPPDFPQKHLVGAAATFTCGATCACNVTKSCTGSVTFYSDAACATGAKLVPADGTCRDPGFTGAYLSYKATTTPATTCTVTGNSTATNARVTPARTVCCR